ncbi:MAG: NAD(P)(+) transhydrogenase (Re/Si-specific) subunit beta [Proteobacteria bacterium]|nr:NAD(P)(+) transhydrogenase (Re/Si-specific) subunit beta [Pseudomonadota bacterium]
MFESALPVAYVAAAILFILSLGGLANQESARRGNVYGIVGMIIALVATVFHERIESYSVIAGAIGLGAVLGAILAARVAMTSMPQLVAALHSFVGLAAVLVGLSSYLDPGAELTGAAHIIHDLEIYADVAIGAVTFTGSVVAWGKLDGKIGGRPLLLPGRHLLNLLMVISIAVLAVLLVRADGDGFNFLLIMSAIAAVLGIHLVMAIGGADMPVVVSLLNSYSGWTAAAAGFMLENDLLIVTGALVGSSGAILSYIMCKAMNRSIWNVVFGGFGAAPPKGAPKPAEGEPGEFTEIQTTELADELKAAREIIIVPGYGMAVAQAQRSVDDFTKLMQKRGARVRFAIHPVAGRLPGHMNVLLAEAGVPYDLALEMDEINDDFPKADVVLVIGANDIVNPSAMTDTSSPIYGMPVCEVWKSTRTVVLKRGRGVGYAGVANPLFFMDKTRMYFGDAKDSMDKLNTALKA